MISIRELKFSRCDSFGIVMWEIVARDVPYNEREFRWTKDVKDAILAGARPSSPRGMDRSYGDLEGVLGS